MNRLVRKNPQHIRDAPTAELKHFPGMPLRGRH
jgi:hypothetical protein